MNIGIVTAWFASGAGYVSKSYKQVLSIKHNVFIYSRGAEKGNKNPQWNNENVTWAPPHPCLTGIHRKHFENWIRRCKLDTIIFNEQRYWQGIIIAKQIGIMIGAYVDYYTQDTVPFYSLYDYLICNTKRHFSIFKDHPQVCYCPWGTDIERYKPHKENTKRPITFIASAGWTGLYARCQSWMDRRGAGIAMRVFNQIKDESRFIIFSQVSLEECPVEWQRLVAENDRIEFRVGTFDPMPYQIGDVYVYPSRLDGIGLTLPEALSCGLPAITTDCAPMNEFVYDKENGLLIRVKEFRGRPDGYYWPESICDGGHLAEAFKYYIDNPEAIDIHGKKARALAERDLNWEKNGAVLCNWISQNKITGKLSESFIDELCKQAIKYDRRNNPTPIYRILNGGKALLSYINKL